MTQHRSGERKLETSPFARMPATVPVAKPPASHDGFDAPDPSFAKTSPMSLASPVVAAPPASTSSEDEPAERMTTPSRPAARAVDVADTHRTDVAGLLQAMGPFLWSLEQAAKWARQLADAGDVTADQHARSLGLLAQIITQLQFRIDEVKQLR